MAAEADIQAGFAEALAVAAFLAEEATLRAMAQTKCEQPAPVAARSTT